MQHLQFQVMPLPVLAWITASPTVIFACGHTSDRRLEQPFTNGSVLEHMKGPCAARHFRILPDRLRILATSCLVVLFVSCSVVSAQTPQPDQDTTPQAPNQQEPKPPLSQAAVNVESLPKNLFVDQKDFWTAPLHFSEKQWDWALPTVLVGGLLIKA